MKAAWSASPSSAVPSIWWGPRSFPACGSIATTATPGEAACASRMVDLPR